MHDNGVENLADAIVIQAARDYVKGRVAQETGKRFNKDCNPRELIKFFDGGYFQMLTGLNPKELICKLDALVDVYVEEIKNTPTSVKCILPETHHIPA